MARLRTFSEWLALQDGDDMVAHLARYAAHHPSTAHAATPEEFAETFAGVFGGLRPETEHALHVAGYRWRNSTVQRSLMGRAYDAIQLHDLVFGLPPHVDPPGGPLPPIGVNTSARPGQRSSETDSDSQEAPND